MVQFHLKWNCNFYLYLFFSKWLPSIARFVSLSPSLLVTKPASEPRIQPRIIAGKTWYSNLNFSSQICLRSSDSLLDCPDCPLVLQSKYVKHTLPSLRQLYQINYLTWQIFNGRKETKWLIFDKRVERYWIVSFSFLSLFPSSIHSYYFGSFEVLIVFKQPSFFAKNFNEC